MVEQVDGRLEGRNRGKVVCEITENVKLWACERVRERGEERAFGTAEESGEKSRQKWSFCPGTEFSWGCFSLFLVFWGYIIL